MTTHRPTSHLSVTTLAPPPLDASEGDAALAAVIDRALALPAKAVRRVQLGADLALYNAQIGRDSVLARSDALTDIPRYDERDVRDVVTLALAYGVAMRRIDRTSDGEIARLVRVLAPLRRKAFTSAESLALAGRIPMVDVKRIARGYGRIVGAQDAIDLAALMRAHWSDIHGMTPVTDDDLVTLERTGHALLGMLRPKGGRRRVRRDTHDAIELRDRVGTLLLAAWERLWRWGALAYGWREVRSRVPALAAGNGGRPRMRPVPAPLQQAA
jgi:hypothetical protein